jgi:spore maturation protein CgeB
LLDAAQLPGLGIQDRGVCLRRMDVQSHQRNTAHRSDHVANDSLRRIYSSAAIVLCDHWPAMRAHRFAANRTYDALACEALVVSDDVTGLNGSVGKAVATYAQPHELGELIERLLADPAERARRVAGVRERILASETFDDRAPMLVALVREVRTTTPAAVRFPVTVTSRQHLT